MSVIDSISEHLHEVSWPDHCESCETCRAMNPFDDFEKLYAEGQDLAEWMQEA